MLKTPTYKSRFLSYLEERTAVTEPKQLYEPIAYILGLGGKRLRPILALMGADVFGASWEKALDAALAVEVFHNFTLLHDDIMDGAPLRRSQPTVHEKWDVNTAILSGDAMLILSYQYLESYEGTVYKQLMHVFNQTALEVCEGQQYDMDFESEAQVSEASYLEMIRLKTSVLVAAALKMGAIIAEAPEEQAQKIYDFGLNLGIAFQLQDDYLDAFGDPKTFGKQVGGDIIENKKTYLYIQALKAASAEDRSKLLQLFGQHLEDNTTKIAQVKALFEKTAADRATQQAIQYYTEKAFACLQKMDISEEKRTELQVFGEALMVRKV